MTALLIGLTARQLLGRRRVLVILLLAVIPVALALIYRLASPHDDPPPQEFAVGILNALIVPLLLPLGALVFGTAALGAEIEDSTVVYLLVKPIARWRIVVAKVVVAAGASLALVAPATLVTSLVILGGVDPDRITAGFVAGVTVGAITYSTVFVALSALTGRALVFGLAYVFVWEAFVTNIFAGTRWISVREYVLGVADGVSRVQGAAALDARLTGPEATVAALGIVALSLFFATWLLNRFEVGERA